MTDLFEPSTIAAIALVFLIAGTVKGVIGVGLPTISLGLLVLVMDLLSAMSLLIIPSLATNLWQASTGGHFRSLFRRLWPFLLVAAATVWLGVLLLSRIDLSLLSCLLGALLAIYSGLSLSGFRLKIPERREPAAGLLFGAANGLLTGMTGSFVVPGVVYLQATGLSRDRLIQAMGMLFLVLTAALGLALRRNDLFDNPWMIASAFTLIPTGFGMALGQVIRRHLPEPLFRRVFFHALLILGIYIVVHSVVGLT